MLSAASLGLAPPPSAATAASVGRVACDGRELLVLGTAHTPCASAAEARALVASAKPDVLMLEIDQERLDALLQRGSSLYGVPLGAEFAAPLLAQLYPDACSNHFALSWLFSEMVHYVWTWLRCREQFAGGRCCSC